PRRRTAAHACADPRRACADPCSCRCGQGRRRRGALEPLEKRERERDRDEREPTQRFAVPLLQSCELRAVGTFPEVFLQAALLLAPEPSVRGPRDRLLRLGARELVRELVRQGASCSDEARLERPGG